MIFARKQAYMPSSERVELLEKLVSTARDLIVTMDQEGRVESCNPAIQVLLGYMPLELLGHPISEFMIKPHRLEHEALMAKYLVERDRQLITSGRRIELRRKNGTRVPVSITMSEFTLGGKPVLSAVIRDISKILVAEKAMEKRISELSRSNVELEKFAASAAFDLEQPVDTILELVDPMISDADGKVRADAPSSLVGIKKTASWMRTLIGDLLSLARVGGVAGDETLTCTKSVFDTVLKEFVEREQSFEIEATCGILPQVAMERGQLYRIVKTLVSNGLKFRREGVPPKLHLGVEDRGSFWVFCLEDNGIGIHADQLENVFLPFRRLQERSRSQGVGVSLAIAKKIVEAHGGSVWVESEPAKGSKFYFSLSKA